MNRRMSLLTTILAAGAISLVLSACGGAAATPLVIADEAVVATEPPVIPRNTGGTLAINVNVTDQGFEPNTIFMAQGQRVKLVVRNQGATEHHFHIIGLDPENMLWAAKATEMEGVGNVDLEEEDDGHNHDHGGLVDFHMCTSAFGICPTGLSVHAHAAPGDMDIILFTTTNQGNFRITDPLHQNLMGTAIVF